MRRVFAILTGVAIASSFSVAAAATDPAGILSTYRAATGGDAWSGKAVMKTVARLSGQGMTDTLSHDAPGTVVHFKIQRGGKTHAVAVTLRDQI